ncbi:hypothetical protein HPP92_005546 [Vanilla planifolia]|uniref:Arf-GAP domain-containing protein n=1 Tax=Vanilla planifolia TaxID=51239 RepID=A0A835RKG4_VANPL|nr:hypothetical protein HPP92_005546 [Vanilla planifolia]
MANRMKDDEKNEKIIRGLLKLPANRRCINCNGLGPQYVCTNFWTFICTNCSGLHREFTHRVKSISMAKFTTHEVSALQAGGNEHAREIFFKEWDPQRHSYPDNSNLDRLRDFIKHVYVERRYAGGKNIDVSPRVKGNMEDYDESRRSDTYRSGSRSPPFDESYGRRYGERPGSAGRDSDRSSRSTYDSRIPGHDQSDYRSPNRYEMRNEIDDKAAHEGQNPKTGDINTSEGVPRPGVSDHQKGVYISSPPMVRPVRDILGTDVPPLRVGEHLKVNGGKARNSHLGAEVTTPSSSGRNDGNSVELKRVNFGSLIDFSADPLPPSAGAGQEPFSQQTASVPANDGDWASFDVSHQKKAQEVATNADGLESVFAQLYVNAPASVVNSTISPATSIDPFAKPNDGVQWQAEQQHQVSQFQVTPSPPINPQISTLVGSLNKGSASVLDAQPSRPVMHPSHVAAVAGSPQNSLEANLTGRKELPVDLFTGVYPASAPYPGWQTRPYHGMVYSVQYPVMMPVSPFPSSSASINPFDIANESVSAQNHMLQSSAALQGVLPNPSNPVTLPNSSKMAAIPSEWIRQQFSHPSAAPSGPYMTQHLRQDVPQQLPHNLFPTMNQGSGIGSEGSGYGIPAPTSPHLGSHYSITPSVGGNPFG